MRKQNHITFSPPMMAAFMAGRKTQTRRLIELDDPDFENFYLLDAAAYLKKLTSFCPYGKVGDKLWTKEIWAPCDKNGFPRSRTSAFLYGDKISYKTTLPENFSKDVAWRSPRYMPKWASRATIELTRVRAQKIQDITEDDARAEGVLPAFPVADKRWLIGFQRYWDSIQNEPWAMWDANPWVFALDFFKVRETI